MSVTAMQRKVVSLEGELQSFQTQVDSSLVGLGVTNPSQLPPLDPSELESKGLRKVLGAVLAVFGVERPPPRELPEIPDEKRRKIEELRVRLLQTDRRLQSFNGSHGFFSHSHFSPATFIQYDTPSVASVVWKSPPM